MAQYSNLKAYIEEKIYENGTQAITGDILQDVLKVMTDDLGEFYQTGGVASPSTDPGTPDAKVIYFATEAGTYTNFGGITLAAGEVALLIFETSWTKETLNVLSAANGGVKTANLADGAVTTEKIAGGAVETAKIANNAVTSGKVADGAIGTAKIADGAIDADKIAANAVESAKIKNGAVTEGKINDGAVTAGKIASNAVTTAKIADDAVTTAKLNDGAVTEDKIATDAVTSGKVKDGAIGTAKIAAGAVTHAKIGAGAVEESNIKDGAVTSDKIADGAVGSDQLAEGAFSAQNLADGSVTTDKLADDAVTAEKIADGAVTAGKFANGSVTTIKLGSGAVTTEKIGDGMVTRQKLADSSVGTSKIIDGAVTTDKVADGAITDAKLENPVSVSQNTLSIGGNYAGEMSTTYDVTLHSGQTFASLSALLSDANLVTLIPLAVRKGGMSIKFVQTSDNKYVQYRYMGTSVTGSPNPFLDITQWVQIASVEDIDEVKHGQLIRSVGNLSTTTSLQTGNIYCDVNLGTSIAVGTTVRLQFSNNVNAIKTYDAYYGSERVYEVTDGQLTITTSTSVRAIRMIFNVSSTNEYLKIYEQTPSIDYFKQKEQEIENIIYGDVLYKNQSIAINTQGQSGTYYKDIDVSNITGDIVVLHNADTIKLYSGAYGLLAETDKKEALIHLGSSVCAHVRLISSTEKNAYISISDGSNDSLVKTEATAVDDETFDSVTNSRYTTILYGNCAVRQKYINIEDGEEVQEANHASTDFIDIYLGQTKIYVYAKEDPSNTHAGMAFYDAEKTYINGVQYTSEKPQIIPVPSGARYARFSLNGYYTNNTSMGIVVGYDNAQYDAIQSVKKLYPISYDINGIMPDILVNSFSSTTLSEEGLTITGESNKSIYINKVIYSLEADFCVRFINNNNALLRIGFKSKEGESTYSVTFKLQTNSNWVQYQFTGSTKQSYSKASATNGDEIELSVKQYYDEVLLVINNITQGKKDYCSYKISMAYTGTGCELLNTLQPVLYVDSGSITVESFYLDNLIWKRNPSFCIIGTSGSTMYYAGDREHCWNLIAFNGDKSDVASVTRPGYKSIQILNDGILDEAISLKPKYMLIMVSGNDVLAGVNVYEYKRNIKAIIDKCLSNHVTPILMTLYMVYSSHRPSYNDRLKELAAEYCIPLIDADSVVTSDMIVADGIHMNADGHEAIGNLVASVINKLV